MCSLYAAMKRDRQEEICLPEECLIVCKKKRTNTYRERKREQEEKEGSRKKAKQAKVPNARNPTGQIMMDNFISRGRGVQRSWEMGESNDRGSTRVVMPRQGMDERDVGVQRNNRN